MSGLRTLDNLDIDFSQKSTEASARTISDMYKGANASTDDGYQLVMSGLSECRKARVVIERRRKELKADAITWGRSVDREAKRLTRLFEVIETPLKATRKEEDDRVAAEKEASRVRREKEKTEKEESERAERLRAEEAERQRRKEEEDAERERRLAEHESSMAERKDALDKEREAVEVERAKLAKAQADAQEIIDRNAEQQRKVDSERDAETDRKKKQQDDLDATLTEEAAAELHAKLAPDIVALRMFARSIEQIHCGALRCPESKDVATEAVAEIADAMERVWSFVTDWVDREEDAHAGR